MELSTLLLLGAGCMGLWALAILWKSKRAAKESRNPEDESHS